MTDYLRPYEPNRRPIKRGLRELADGQRRCSNCYYAIEGIENRICPECGEAFDPDDPNTYFHLPKYDRFAFWKPALITQLVIGLVAIAVLLATQSFGFVLSCFLPLAIGAALGYSYRGSMIGKILIWLFGLLTIGSMVVAMHPSGGICGVILFTVLFVPLGLGLAAGSALRYDLRTRDSFAMRDYLAMLLLVLIPFGAGLIEPRGMSTTVENVRTTRTIPIAPDRIWESLLFFEETRGDAPAILDFLLPTPVAVEGDMAAVGDVTTCVYENGALVKRVTEVVPDRLLRFEVIEQTIDMDHIVLLDEGAFILEPDGAGGTVLTLETTYRSAMRPRFAWRWSERMSVRALHGHVIEEIRLNASDEPDERVVMR